VAGGAHDLATLLDDPCSLAQQPIARWRHCRTQDVSLDCISEAEPKAVDAQDPTIAQLF
jgi:hypothetical protein